MFFVFVGVSGFVFKGESHAPHSRGVDFVQRGVSHCVLEGSLNLNLNFEF